MNKNYIVQALRSGFSQSQIAQGLGVTQSAISQYVEEHSLLEEVAAQSQFMSIDSKLNKLEEKIVDKLGTSMQFAVMDPMKWAGLLKIVNGAKRRSLSEGRPILEGGAQLVTLNLPERMHLQVRRNAHNEVIEVEGRVLQTLPAGKLVDMATKSLPSPADVEEVSYEPVPKSAIANLL